MKFPSTRSTLAAILFCIIAVPAAAQSQYLELLRSDLKAERVALVTDAMNLSEADAEVFWPIYRDYDHERATLGDEKLSLIRDYAANYVTMMDETAKDLMERVFKLDEKHISLQKKYFKKMRKELGATTSAKFFQVDRQINMLVNLKVASEMPLIEKGAVETEGY